MKSLNWNVIWCYNVKLGASSAMFMHLCGAAMCFYCIVKCLFFRETISIFGFILSAICDFFYGGVACFCVFYLSHLNLLELGANQPFNPFSPFKPDWSRVPIRCMCNQSVWSNYCFTLYAAIEAMLLLFPSAYYILPGVNTLVCVHLHTCHISPIKY